MKNDGYSIIIVKQQKEGGLNEENGVLNKLLIYINLLEAVV